MCGIVGYIGAKNAVPILLDGLKTLEYRGYDSTGIAVVRDGVLELAKKKGRLSVLKEELKSGVIMGNIGVGHTRWATHGAPDDVNAHPHISSEQQFAVVHNGIIENYLEIKNFLSEQGVNCVSDTDTETVAHLIEYYYNGDFLGAVIKAVEQSKGSYALGVLCRNHEDMLVVARKDSPLVVGLGDGEQFIASDPTALAKYTKNMYLLENGEYAVLTRDSIQVFNSKREKIDKKVFNIDWDITEIDKCGYEHFMLKEIFEEPQALKNAINPRIKVGNVCIEGANITKDMLEATDRICIVACGTAYHSGAVGKYVIEKLTRMPVYVETASEFRYMNPIISDRTLVIVISQSGETLDTLSAMREVKKSGATVIAVVNVVGSSLAREAGQVIYTWAGPEIAVASTKAYSTQLAVLYLLAIDWARKLGSISTEDEKALVDALTSIPELVQEAISTTMSQIEDYASRHCGAKSVFYIGRNLDYALAMEGSLKLKEISYIHSEAYAGGELKHGTIALIEEGTLVICPMTQANLMDKMLSNIKEVKARGAHVLAITQSNNRVAGQIADEVIFIPNVASLIAPIVAVAPLQMLAYFMAVKTGRDVDRPRNLAKSVTVE